MRISRLEIENFKAVKNISLSNLEDIVVIAGPNGCGKSCVLDAIRLVKSCYGGYQPNEWQQWFGEFEVNINARDGTKDLLKFFQDRSKNIRLLAEFNISQEERNYLKIQASSIIERLVWGSIAPDPNYGGYVQRPAMASEQRTHGELANQRISEFHSALERELVSDAFVGEVVITPDFEIHFSRCTVLELVFSTYDPKNIGVIDYHGAGRNYNREQIGGINLNIASSEQTLSQHALYNYTNKYSNIKTEMASSYIRDLIAKEVGVSFGSNTLIETLQELFETFFPGKQFLGPQPTENGGMIFPVQLDTGETHDINELSSGEKEVLYGYLRLRNAAPRNSVLLLDEPELHLNPRLIRGLPRFYQKHLGEAFGNQIWLITHSDAFLRETVGELGFSVSHMQPASVCEEGANQLRTVDATEDVERAVIDLVGDLATYQPGAKIVILEGGGDSEFDLYMTSQLFPDLQSRANVLSAGNKKRVREFHELLNKAVSSGAIDLEVYSIVDRDFDADKAASSGESLSWDVYHIENYLLVSKYLTRVLIDYDHRLKNKLEEDTVEQSLQLCAQETLGSLVRVKLQKEINARVVSSLDIGVDPSLSSFASAFREASERAPERLALKLNGELSLESLEELENDLRVELEAALQNGEWKSKFRGRDILKRFVALQGNGMKYEHFRNLVIARMRDDNYQPQGMREILSTIMPPL